MNVIGRVNTALIGVALTPSEADQLHALIRARTLDEHEPTNRPTVSEAVDAVRAASYKIHDPGTPQHGTHIVHVVGPDNIGADLDLEYVLTLIRVAGTSRLAWIDTPDRHTLTIDRGRSGVVAVEAVREDSNR